MSVEVIVSIVGEGLILLAVIWRGGALVGRLDTLLGQHEGRLDDHDDRLKGHDRRIGKAEQSISYLDGRFRR